MSKHRINVSETAQEILNMTSEINHCRRQQFKESMRFLILAMVLLGVIELIWGVMQ